MALQEIMLQFQMMGLYRIITILCRVYLRMLLNSNVLSEIFSSMTNTSGKLTNFITFTTSGKELTELARVIISITYSLPSGSRTFDSKPSK